MPFFLLSPPLLPSLVLLASRLFCLSRCHVQPRGPDYHLCGRGSRGQQRPHQLRGRPLGVVAAVEQPEPLCKESQGELGCARAACTHKRSRMALMCKGIRSSDKGRNSKCTHVVHSLLFDNKTFPYQRGLPQLLLQTRSRCM